MRWRFPARLCWHIREAVTNLENVGLHDAKTRLWLRLMYLGHRYGSVDRETGRLRITHQFSQQSLADSIGLTRVMVNRQLGSWRDRDLIVYGRGFVEILDLSKLEEDVWDFAPESRNGTSESNLGV